MAGDADDAEGTIEDMLSVLQCVQAHIIGRFLPSVNDDSRVLISLVPMAGLEPARLSALDFESSASTNSTT